MTACQVAGLPSAGHALHENRPAEAAALVAAFLARAAPRPPPARPG